MKNIFEVTKIFQNWILMMAGKFCKFTKNN